MAAKLVLIFTLCTVCLAQAAEQPQVSGLKSESTAITWSLSCTLLPLLTGVAIMSETNKDEWNVPAGLLMSSSIMVGPGAGYIYAGKPSRIWLPMAARTLGFMVFGFSAPCKEYGGDDIRTECNPNVATALGLALFVGAVVYDFTKVDNAVRDHNAERTQNSFSISPRVDPGRRRIMLVASWGL